MEYFKMGNTEDDRSKKGKQSCEVCRGTASSVQDQPSEPEPEPMIPPANAMPPFRDEETSETPLRGGHKIKGKNNALKSSGIYAWMRPELMGKGYEINHYYRYSVLAEVSNKLREYGGADLLEQFSSGPFGSLLQLKMKSSPNNALHDLLAREITHPTFSEHEKWFHVGGSYIRFAAPEYSLMTGLMFGRSDFDPNRRHHIPETSLLRSKYNGERIRVSTLRRDFIAGRLQTPLDYLKAANLLVYYLMLLGRDDPWIEDWAWVLAEDGGAWSSFPWGSYTFQILCHQIAILPKEQMDINNKHNSYSFFGPVWALNIWAFEAIPELGRLCGKRATEPLTPRLLRWKSVRNSPDFGCLFDELKLVCHTSLFPDATEVSKAYFLTSLDPAAALSLKFIPPKRHAHKKIPPIYRVPRVEQRRPSKRKNHITQVSLPAVSPKKHNRGHSDGSNIMLDVHCPNAPLCPQMSDLGEVVYVVIRNEIITRGLSEVVAIGVAEKVKELILTSTDLHHLFPPSLDSA